MSQKESLLRNISVFFYWGMKKLFLQLLCLLIIFNTACVEKIIRKEDLTAKNKELSEFIFTAKADIYPHFIENIESDPEKLLKKGDRVKLVIEVSHDWAKVKAYSEKSNRQQAVGKTVIYIFKKDISQKDETSGELKIEQTLDKYIENMFSRNPVPK